MVIFDYKTTKQSFDIDFRIKPKSAKYIKEVIKKNQNMKNEQKYEKWLIIVIL